MTLSLSPDQFAVGVAFSAPRVPHWLLVTGGTAAAVEAQTCNCTARITRNGSALTSHRCHCWVKQWPLPGTRSAEPLQLHKELQILFGNDPPGIHPGDIIETNNEPYSNEAYTVTSIDTSTDGLQLITAAYSPLKPAGRY